MIGKSRKGRTVRRAATREATAQTVAVEAMRLLGSWLRVAQGHVSFGARCSCGVATSTGGIAVREFELQILDYLFGKHADPAAEPVLAKLREHAGYRAGESGSITPLLHAIATKAPEFGAELQWALLRDLNRSIESFDELHGR
ncbi:MAG: hypothetical protein OEW21_16815 [Betaproteobacteria bacterium]|nr:hypothetical protein [Betaproteobacteria bacterium]